MSVRVRTQLEWSYTPADLFEVGYDSSRGPATLHIGDGVALLTVPGGQPDRVEEGDFYRWILTIIRVRALQVKRTATISDDPSVVEFDEQGHRHVSLRVKAGAIAIMTGQLEAIQTDANGNVVRDSRGERIAAHKSELDDLSTKAATNPVLGHVLNSFAAALDEESVEFVRLYEIRDILSVFYGSEGDARRALDIRRADWSEFGRLSNDAPVFEGRHNGKHADQLRPATADERALMRRLAEEWIRKFAAKCD
jgi:hypothetical protein